MIDLMKRGLGSISVVGGALLLSGCAQFGNPWDALTGDTPAPDEFAVVERKPLRMPQASRLQNLPEPRLGETSPLEPNPNADAARALLGAGATGAAPITSPSEAALVGAARSSNDGVVLTQDDIERAEAARPQEAPTLGQLLNITDDPREGGDPLDADSEARRLQAEGVSPAPVNPIPKEDDE